LEFDKRSKDQEILLWFMATLLRILILALAPGLLWAQAPIGGTTIPSRAEMALRENAVEVQYESGVAFAPFHNLNYVLAPQLLSVNWNLDEIGNDTVAHGWFRGNTQMKFTVVGDPVIEGPESRFVGLIAGPQYNFVQPGQNWVPFLATRVGFVFTDSTDVVDAQGQDFCFTYIISLGCRYYFSEHLSASVGFNYQHFSNGGLSEPNRPNVGMDAMGPVVSAVYSF
jgi:hypothetical protein